MCKSVKILILYTYKYRVCIVHYIGESLKPQSSTISQPLSILKIYIKKTINEIKNDSRCNVYKIGSVYFSKKGVINV